jgi:hypothetical protein
MKTDSVSETLFFQLLECRTMDKVRKPSNSDYACIEACIVSEENISGILKTWTRSDGARGKLL